MADLGQDRAGLELKVMEVEYSINQKELAKKGIQLELARMVVKQRNYEQSLKDIEEQVKTHDKDRASLMEAISNLKEQ